ncbi:L-erythro-3,5-diaminohexanoate dehydrogenase [Mesotoga sp.]|uniref:L-erythro-3,5-diaminohexanoate dehydrogenase n=1 Tax=Mesotoga sp. TaxID=2053577 RepID=UPI001BD63F72|nr:L-erythro-3,5-diaminohexanoate dehydrogenase [Mesotoga sp.]
MKGCPFGSHRVIEPLGFLPQAARKIDNSEDLYDNEISVDVETLNVDSASFTQMREACKDDELGIAAMIIDIVNNRGKLQNPVTGSGGMLIGRVSRIGEALKDRKLEVGDRIASLVSLSLTPLKIERILKVHLEKDQVDVEGKAILFESGIYAKLPSDIPAKMALAVLDVAGAPAQVDKLVRRGMSVAILGGGGKSGVLCCYQAMKKCGDSGKVIVVEYSEENAKRIRELNLAHEVVIADATKPLEVYNKIHELTAGKLCDVVVNNVNVPNTEMSSILVTKNEGIVYFFSMATSFTRAALGAEGVGKDITMIIGNGYTKGHDELALDILRESDSIRRLFQKLYI